MYIFSEYDDNNRQEQKREFWNGASQEFWNDVLGPVAADASAREFWNGGPATAGELLR
jgi:hypothetical protein